MGGLSGRCTVGGQDTNRRKADLVSVQLVVKSVRLSEEGNRPLVPAMHGRLLAPESPKPGGYREGFGREVQKLHHRLVNRGSHRVAVGLAGWGQPPGADRFEECRRLVEG